MKQWTKEQKEVIAGFLQSTAVIAGAGSGKTDVLIARILNLLQNQSASLGEIVAITFTEKAASELRTRLAGHCNAEQVRELGQAPIGTFHSFFARILQEFGPLLGLPLFQKVLDENGSRLLRHQVCRQILLDQLDAEDPDAIAVVAELEFRHASRLLEDLMQFRWHARLHLSKTKDPLLQAVGRLFEKAATDYSNEEAARASLDFQDLEIKTLELLTRHPEAVQTLQKRHRYFFIDEYQDVSDLQNRIVEHLIGPQNVLFIVGDPNQSIYRFRGADVACFQARLEKMGSQKGRLLQLPHNFRSEPGILEFCNLVFGSSWVAAKVASIDKPVIRLGVPTGETATAENRREAEAGIIARYLRREINAGRSPSDFALLFQSLTQIRYYEKGLKKEAIPYALSGGGSFLNRQEILDLVFCLKLEADPKDKMSLAGLLRSPLVGLTDAEILFEFQKGRVTLDHWEGPLFQCLRDKGSLEEVLAITHYDSFVAGLDPTGGKLANIEQLLMLMRQSVVAGMTPEGFVEYLEDLEDKGVGLPEAPTDETGGHAVRILTVHAAKGLEFPVVILPELWRGSPVTKEPYLFLRGHGIACKKRPEEAPFGDRVATEDFENLYKVEKEESEAERKRLLYVATTRAQEKLVLLWPDAVKRAGPWYSWVAEGLEKYSDAAPLTIPEGPEKPASPATFVFPEPLLERPPESPLQYVTVTELNATGRHPSPSRGEGQGGGDSLSPADWGTLIHAVLRHYHPQKNPNLSASMDRLAKEFCYLPSPEEKDRWRQRLQQFVSGPIAPVHWDGLHEVPFRFLKNNQWIYGVVDYLALTDKGWILYDFKTDHKMEPEKYRPQMETYAEALKQTLHEPLVEKQLLYIALDEKYVF